MAVQAVIVLLLAWYGLARFRDYNAQQTIGELKRLTPLLAERYAALVADPARIDVQNLNETVRHDAQGSRMRITIVRADGTVIADSDADPATMENHANRPEIQAALQGVSHVDSRQSASTHQQTVYLAQLIGTPQQPVAIVRAALPLALITVDPAQVIRAVAAATMISLIVTFIAIYLISRQLSQTVSRMADGAARFAAGDLQHRIDRPASSELAALADALNHMAVQLKEQIDLLQAQRAEQQTIYRSMSNAMIALDLNQRVISVNRAAEQLLLLKGSTTRGRLLQEVVREPELNRFVAEALQNPSKAPAEFDLHSRPGRTVQAISESLRDVRDQPIGILVFINDVTQLRRLESIRSDFAANVSHELRTPITNIKGYVETMMDVGFSDSQQSRRFLEVIHRNTNRLASIIEDLLALARLEQPDTTIALERTDVEVARIAEAALAPLEKERAEKRIKVTTAIPHGMHVSGNGQLLEQALSNLLSNAIRYSPPRTTVVISAQRLDTGETELAVRDEGPGIPPEHLDRIFERFYRIDRARSREMGGTGLGLSIVKHIALVHGGRVEVSSEVGQGSEFRIVLPRAVERPSVSAAVRASA